MPKPSRAGTAAHTDTDWLDLQEWRSRRLKEAVADERRFSRRVGRLQPLLDDLDP